MFIANIRGLVIYNGCTLHVTNDFTKDLLERYFEMGKHYTVIKVIQYNGVPHYNFVNFICSYPCKSFYNILDPSYLKDRYNLK